MGDNLLDVYRKAKERDPTYRGAIHTLQAARERVPQARAGLLPVLNLVGASGQQGGQASFGSAPYLERDVRSANWNLQLTQPLLRAASWAALTQAEYQELLAQEHFRQSEQDLILRSAQAYLDVLVALEAERVAGLQVGAVGQQLGLAQRNFEVGTGTVTDVHEAQSRLDLVRAQAVAARSELENRQTELERIVGEQPRTPSTQRNRHDVTAVGAAVRGAGLPQASTVPSGGSAVREATSVRAYSLARLSETGRLPRLQPETVLDWIESARVQSPQVRIAQAALDVAEREIAKSQAAHLPTLDLTAGYGSTFNSGSIYSPADISVRSRSGQVGLSLSIPLYAGAGTQARVREALSLRNKAGEDLEAAQRLAVAQARQAFSGVVNGRAQVEALESAIVSSKSSVDANKIGYRIGTRINIDVLNAEQQLYAAQRDWHRARADTLMQGLRLKAVTATLGETDLQAINHLLETDQR